MAQGVCVIVEVEDRARLESLVDDVAPTEITSWNL